MKNTQKTASLILTASLALAAAPLAFAQQQQADAAAAAQVTAAHDQAATPPAGNAAQAATPATPATPAQPASGERKWSDLDGDGNGSLNATEAAAMPSLAEIFVAADADANGELTQEEYKVWVANNNAAKPTDAGSAADKGKSKSKRGG